MPCLGKSGLKSQWSGLSSRVRTAPIYSLRSREKFGDPSMKAVDPTTQLEPGPGHYRPKKVTCSDLIKKIVTHPGHTCARSQGNEMLPSSRFQRRCRPIHVINLPLDLASTTYQRLWQANRFVCLLTWGVLTSNRNIDYRCCQQ